ncbi:HNH endonuclease signature motif containing protein, partial [Rhodococcoides yunnanense]|uniref:HNH endonuclease signature motif containing protein n=1 Tax=Rhodococcoides yunnanense TaxID=278209 RepID=UPI0022B21AF0
IAPSRASREAPSSAAAPDAANLTALHHIDEWADGGGTDIESLTFGCDVHHRLVGPRERDWATTKAGSGHRYAGRTLWHPPVTLDPARRGRVNHFHHPNEYIYPAEEGPQPGASH